MINIKLEIKKILLENEMTVKALAELMGTSQQNMNAKINKNNLKIQDIEKIADKLGYDTELKFVKRGE